MTPSGIASDPMPVSDSPTCDTFHPALFNTPSRFNAKYDGSKSGIAWISASVSGNAAILLRNSKVSRGAPKYLPRSEDGVSRIDHSRMYSDLTGVYANGAEEFFSRMRRAEIGHRHHITGAYLVRRCPGISLA